MKMKILIMMFCLLLVTSCKSNLENMDSINSRNKFEKDVENIINIVNNDEKMDLEFLSYTYSIKNNNLSSPFGIFYDISEYTIDNGFIHFDHDEKMYLTLENDKYCAIQDFNETKFKVYDISEKEKCHKTYIDGESLTLDILSNDIENNIKYVSGSVSNGIISLFSKNNLLDNSNCKYQWYRNGEKIPDSNVDTYYVVSDFEDADYYVEMTTYEGEVIRSNIVNVKIDKK